jgi:LuxR family maltose regulon positive regulatory protein
MAEVPAGLIVAQREGQVAARVPPGFLAWLQRARDVGPGTAPVAVPGPVDQLTRRELEMLAAGKSNQAIAGQLVVTFDTVKKHVTHILGKLGVAKPHRGCDPGG